MAEDQLPTPWLNQGILTQMRRSWASFFFLEDKHVLCLVCFLVVCLVFLVSLYCDDDKKTFLLTHELFVAGVLATYVVFHPGPIDSIFWLEICTR